MEPQQKDSGAPDVPDDDIDDIDDIEVEAVEIDLVHDQPDTAEAESGPSAIGFADVSAVDGDADTGTQNAPWRERVLADTPKWKGKWRTAKNRRRSSRDSRRLAWLRPSLRFFAFCIPTFMMVGLWWWMLSEQKAALDLGADLTIIGSPAAVPGSQIGGPFPIPPGFGRVDVPSFLGFFSKIGEVMQAEGAPRVLIAALPENMEEVGYYLAASAGGKLDLYTLGATTFDDLKTAFQLDRELADDNATRPIKDAGNAVFYERVVEWDSGMGMPFFLLQVSALTAVDSRAMLLAAGYWGEVPKTVKAEDEIRKNCLARLEEWVTMMQKGLRK